MPPHSSSSVTFSSIPHSHSPPSLIMRVIAFCVSFSNLSSLCSIPFFKSQFGFFGARLISSFRYALTPPSHTPTLGIAVASFIDSV